MEQRKPGKEEPRSEAVPEKGAESAPDGVSSPHEDRPRVVDKRRFREGEADAASTGEEAGDGAGARRPTYVEELQRKVAVAEEKLREHIERINRETAEFRARQERELERRSFQARKQMVLGFLRIADDLSRATTAASEALEGEKSEQSALEGIVQGMQMIQRQFFEELTSMGVVAIKAKGTPFDPECHEAVRVEEVDDPVMDGMVVEEMKKGYMMEEDVLRPSQVCVGRVRMPSEGRS